MKNKMIQCPVCPELVNGNKMTEGVWNAKEQTLKPKENLDCYRCEKCGHIFVNYRESGLEFHKDEWRKKHGGRGGIKFNSSFHKEREDIVTRRYTVLQKFVDFKNCNSLLDVGAGGGSFLLKLQKYSTLHSLQNIEAQEISSHCIDYLKKMGFKTHEGDFNKIKFDKQYDIVTAWHIVEHVKDVKTLAKQIGDITKKYFIVEVPMASGSNGGYGRNPNTHQLGFNGHFHFFTKKSMVCLFKNYFKSWTTNGAIQGGKHSLQIIFRK